MVLVICVWKVNTEPVAWQLLHVPPVWQDIIKICWAKPRVFLAFLGCTTTNWVKQDASNAALIHFPTKKVALFRANLVFLAGLPHKAVLLALPANQDNTSP
jgi:hypothetical protein